MNINLTPPLTFLKEMKFFRHPKEHFSDFKYYLKCMIGGAFSCGFTHTLLTPIDTIKCKK